MNAATWLKRNDVTTSYVIRSIIEECYCEHCGMPLMVGDRITVLRDDNRPHCSKTCARMTVEADSAI